MIACYSLRVQSRACENFGKVDYTITDTISIVDGGIRVDTRSIGISDGERIDQRASKFYPSPLPTVLFESACAYRVRLGYSLCFSRAASGGLS